MAHVDGPTAAGTGFSTADGQSQTARLLSGTMRRGQVLEVGPWRISYGDGHFVLECRGRAKVALAAVTDVHAALVCEITGDVHPVLLSPPGFATDGDYPRERAGTPAQAGQTGGGSGVDGARSEPPLLRLGPGGDYVDDIYPEDLGLCGAGRAESDHVRGSAT